MRTSVVRMSDAMGTAGDRRLRRGTDDRSCGMCGQGVRESDWLGGGRESWGVGRVGNIKQAEVKERGKAWRVLYAANGRTEKPSEGS